MDASTLGLILASMFGGGFLAELVRIFRGRKTDAVKLATEFYPLWMQELDRLRAQLDELHALIAALETELISLGGDPFRVRLEAARILKEERGDKE